MAETGKGQKLFIGAVIILVVFLIGTYVFNYFMGNKISLGSPILLYIITGFLMVIGFFIIKNSQVGTTTDLDKMLPLLLLAALLIYLLLKFMPSLLPSSFSILASKTFGGL